MTAQTVADAHVIDVHTEWTPTRKRLKVCKCTCGWESPRGKTRHAVLRFVALQHPQAFCPTPGKRRHKTRKDAELVLLEFWRTAPSGKKELRRAYECVCGCWHTTSKAAAYVS